MSWGIAGIACFGAIVFVLPMEAIVRLPAYAQQKANRFHVDVSPTGWRRTVDGWERAEEWLLPKFLSPHDLNGWIAIEKARQSTAAGKLLNGLNAIHPLIHAAALLTAVILIFLIHERMVKDRRDWEMSSRISAD